MDPIIAILIFLMLVAWWRVFAFFLLLCLIAAFPPMGLAIIATSALVWIAFKR